MDITALKKNLHLICLLAKEGNKDAQEYLMDKYSLKVWTVEELKKLNEKRRLKANQS